MKRLLILCIALLMHFAQAEESAGKSVAKGAGIVGKGAELIKEIAGESKKSDETESSGLGKLDIKIDIDVITVDTDLFCYKDVDVKYGKIGAGAQVVTKTGSCKQDASTKVGKLGTTGERKIFDLNNVLKKATGNSHSFGMVNAQQEHIFKLPAANQMLYFTFKASDPATPSVAPYKMKAQQLKNRGQWNNREFQVVGVTKKRGQNITLELFGRANPSLTGSNEFYGYLDIPVNAQSVNKSIPISVDAQGTVSIGANLNKMTKEGQAGYSMIDMSFNIPRSTP